MVFLSATLNVVFDLWPILQVAYCCCLTDTHCGYRSRHNNLRVYLWNGLLPAGLPSVRNCAWFRSDSNYYRYFLVNYRTVKCKWMHV